MVILKCLVGNSWFPSLCSSRKWKNMISLWLLQSRYCIAHDQVRWCSCLQAVTVENTPWGQPITAEMATMAIISLPYWFLLDYFLLSKDFIIPLKMSNRAMSLRAREISLNHCFYTQTHTLKQSLWNVSFFLLLFIIMFPDHMLTKIF